MIFPVGLWTAMDSLQDALTNPMKAPKAYEQLTEYVSVSEPANGGVSTDEITAVIGDFSALTAGLRTDITLEVSGLGAGLRKGRMEARA